MRILHPGKLCTSVGMSARGWLVAACLLFCANAVAADVVGPAEMLSAMTDQTLARLRDNPGLLNDPRQARRLAEELILPNIDFRTSARWVLGKYWRTASNLQRETFTLEFRELLVNTYLRSMGKYQDYTIRILSARPGQPPGRAVVDAEVEQPNGPRVKVLFRLHHRQRNWLVYDIVIEGISLVATHRSGFANEIRSKGLDSLIAHLVVLNASEATAAGVSTRELP